MRFVQPYPKYSCTVPVKPEDRVESPAPLYFIRYRYPHHAASSGYDRLCDYTGETIRLSKSLYLMGETILRLPAIAVAKLGGHFEYSRYDFTMELEVLRHFLRHRNSVYHFVYGEKSYNLLSRFAGRNGNKIVLTVHHPPEHHAWLFESTDHFKKVDFVTVVSKVMIPYWSELVGADRVAYVPHGVDANYFVPAPEPVANRPPRCLFVGFHERDFEVLDQIIPRILASNPRVQFVMISPDRRCGPMAQGRERVSWLRGISDKEYLEYLQHSDLLVLPLKGSTTNNAVLEALACGLPVITNAGGIEDYLEPKSSIVLPVGDVAGMCTAVLDLLDDDSRRARMSQAAREQALCFSWHRTAQKMVNIYRELLPLAERRR